MKTAKWVNAVWGERCAEPALFRSFFMGGFECSTFYRRNGKRLDLVTSTKHDRFCHEDYGRLQNQGMLTAREGIRWHLIEKSPRQYDFSSAMPMVRNAAKLGMQILWDLCHYGWPDDIDIFSSEFVGRFAGVSAAFARVVRDEMEGPHFFAPINEISFFSWAGAESAKIGPYQRHRGFELKCQLVRASVAAMEA